MYKPRAEDLLQMLRQYIRNPRRVKQEGLLRVLVRSTIMLLGEKAKREKKKKDQEEWERTSDLYGINPND